LQRKNICNFIGVSADLVGGGLRVLADGEEVEGILGADVDVVVEYLDGRHPVRVVVARDLSEEPKK
jgi:hypothetical protein